MSVERPILFSGEMIRALLDNRKTQTRRVIKPGKFGLNIDAKDDHTDWPYVPPYIVGRNDEELPMEDRAFECPYGAPGDVLWVRETWGLHAHFDVTDWCRDSLSEISESDVRERWAIAYAADAKSPQNNEHWRSPGVMPRWASRITLTVTDVRVERVQDITEADAIAEGVSRLFSDEEMRTIAGENPWTNYLWHGRTRVTAKQEAAWSHQYSSYSTARESYGSLWASINGVESWARNDWVWVVSFAVKEIKR